MGIPTLSVADIAWPPPPADWRTRARPSHGNTNMLGTTLEAAVASAQSLPASLVAELRSVSDGDRAALVLTDLELGEWGPTPAGSTARLGDSMLEGEWRLLLLATVLGHPFAYPQEKAGQLLQDVVAVPTQEDALTSESSRLPLTLHTEVAFHPYPPDHLVLACVRAAPLGGGEWQIASLSSALDIMTERNVEQLKRGHFATGLDITFGGHDVVRDVAPLTARRWRYDFELMKGLSARDADALLDLDRALAAVVIAHKPAAGDVLLVDNRQAAHGRSPFDARYDANDRWILRLLTRTALPRDSDCEPPFTIVSATPEHISENEESR